MSSNEDKYLYLRSNAAAEQTLILSSAAEYSDAELQLSRSLITVGGSLLEPSIIS